MEQGFPLQQTFDLFIKFGPLLLLQTRFITVKWKRALIDTGCTATLIHSDFLNVCKGTSIIEAVNGKEVICRGVSTVTMEIRGRLLRVEAIVINGIIEGVDVIVGMNVIRQLGGVTAVGFREVHCAVSTQPTAMTRKRSEPSPCKIKDKDFNASFDSER